MNRFNYIQPKSLKEASDFLINSPGAIPYAGGTDALDLIKHEVLDPKNVVNLKLITGLDKIKYTSGKGLVIGSLVRITEIAEHKEISEKYPIITQAAKEIASPQLRNMGTLGGNICQRPRCWYYREDFDCIRKGGDICHAFDGKNKFHCVIGGGPCFIVHPSDMAVALLALDASVTIFSGKSERVVPISEFFILPEDDYLKENILEPGEIVKEIFVPELPSNTVSGYVKFKERAVWDFAVVSVGAVIRKNGNSIEKAKIALGGVAPKPWSEENFNNLLRGKRIDESVLTEASKQLLKDAEPLEMNEYKITLARNLTKQLIIDINS